MIRRFLPSLQASWRFPSYRRAALYGVLTAVAVAAGVEGRSLAWRMIVPQRAMGTPIVPGSGSLMIVGGGTTPEEVRNRFVELAGGSRAEILVIPTAHKAADTPEADEIYLAPWRDRGAASVRMLHTRSRAEADDPAFLEPLTRATGVWIAGGRQGTLADIYAGTEVERQLKRLIARGGVVGGSSAGAAIMTRVMILGGRAEAVEGVGFDLLADAVVDQHFLKRRRTNRLINLLGKHPGLLGFGIDEQTALLVRGNRLDVLGNSYVVAFLPRSDGLPPKMEFLRRGDEADLASLRGPAPRIIANADIDEALSSGN